MKSLPGFWESGDKHTFIFSRKHAIFSHWNKEQFFKEDVIQWPCLLGIKGRTVLTCF
jgi:hypothetical protein